MSDLRNLQGFFTRLIQAIGSADAGSSTCELTQKIEDTLIGLQSNLRSVSDQTDLLSQLRTWKSELQATAYKDVLEDPIVQQVDQLLDAIDRQHLAAIGTTLGQFADQYEGAVEEPDIKLLLGRLEQAIPQAHFAQIGSQLERTPANLLPATLRLVSQQLQASPDQLDLDAVVQIFEQKLGHLLEPDRTKKEEQKMKAYRSIARSSILKSLKSHGIRHTDD